jgi:hypothetical protein
MSVCIYSVFVQSYMYVADLRRPDPPSKESYRLCKRLRNWKSGQGPTKGCRATDLIRGIYRALGPRSFVRVDSCSTKWTVLCTSWINIDKGLFSSYKWRSYFVSAKSEIELSADCQVAFSSNPTGDMRVSTRGRIALARPFSWARHNYKLFLWIVCRITRKWIMK